MFTLILVDTRGLQNRNVVEKARDKVLQGLREVITFRDNESARFARLIIMIPLIYSISWGIGEVIGKGFPEEIDWILLEGEFLGHQR